MSSATDLVNRGIVEVMTAAAAAVDNHRHPYCQRISNLGIVKCVVLVHSNRVGVRHLTADATQHRGSGSLGGRYRRRENKRSWRWLPWK